MNDSLFSVKGKVVIITGGGQGIGEFLALGLSKSGATVYCIDKKFKKGQKKYRGLNKILCDITKLDEIKRTCSEIIKSNKKIDVLINNAGITMPDNLDNYSLDSWTKTLDVNLTGAFLFSQQVLKRMKKNHSGSIINITSIDLLFTPNEHFQLFAFGDKAYQDVYDIPLSLGFGLRQRTKNSVMEVSFGWPVDEAFSRGKVHVKFTSLLD